VHPAGADAGNVTARGTCLFEPVRRTVVADAVADLVDVADVGRRAADRRALRIRGAGRARPVAVLLEVAAARRGPTRGAGGDEGIGRAVVADAVAALLDVAYVGRGPADRRALGIRGTGRARTATVLLEAADARRGRTRRPGG